MYGYCGMFYRVVTDVDLRVPITMGVMGRAGSGKHDLLNKFISKITEEQACCLTCPETGEYHIWPCSQQPKVDFFAF